MATAAFGQTCHAVRCSRNTPAARVTACRAAKGGHDSGLLVPRRRTLLIGASVPLALGTARRSEALDTFELPIDQLSSFERADQRKEFEMMAKSEIKKVLGADDSRKALRLVLQDASTYTAAPKNGGVDGSIVLNKAEAGRPENAGLSDYVSKLATVKEAVDAGNKSVGAEPVTWADLSVLAVKVTTEAEWKNIKVSRAALPSGGETIVKTFGSTWEMKFGRLDSAEEPAKRALPNPSATEEVRTFYRQLGVKPSDEEGVGGLAFLKKTPPFWEKFSFILYSAAQDDPVAAEEKLAADNETYAKIKLDFDRSRATVTRTNYEVDFIEGFTKLAALGAKFNPDCYLHTRKSFRIK